MISNIIHVYRFDTSRATCIHFESGSRHNELLGAIYRDLFPAFLNGNQHVAFRLLF